MKASKIIKVLAAWVMVLVNPCNGAILRDDKEQSMPLLVAIALLVVGIMAIGFLVIIILTAFF